MRSLWFCVPVYGRLQLAAICLKQLRRTCDTLNTNGIAASAVIVIDREEFGPLRRLIGSNLGFGHVLRDNQYLGRKFNDGIQLATDPKYNPHPVDYVVPCGSDDWVDHRLFLEPLPGPDTVVGFQRMSFVREDGAEISTTHIRYQGGSGIRIIPRQLLEGLGYRPADEDRRSGCDTSILTNLRVHHRDQLRVSHQHLHDRQIVDWKTPHIQLNSYMNVTRLYAVGNGPDPFVELAGIYPDEALEEMHHYYATARAETVAA